MEEQHCKAGLFKNFLLLFLFFLALNVRVAFCNNIEDQETPVQDYYRAMHQYTNGQYANAKKSFEDIERRYPTFPFMKQVKIMIVYLLYMDREYGSAVDNIEGFLSMHPNSGYEPYLAYLRAICFYRQVTGLQKSYEMRVKALAEMESVIVRFGDTVYAKKAKETVEYLKKLIIYNEFLIGQTYHNERAYFAAINRYLRALSIDKKTKRKDFLPVIYFRLYECYHDLDINILEDKYRNLFNKSVKNLHGSISFNIEGLISYVSPEYTAEAALVIADKKAAKVAKKEEKNDRKRIKKEIEERVKKEKKILKQEVHLE
ncbi:MAG: outer membrane protein assembly factor BamD [Alphaproteobacteria bacterium]|nr:outer membrane protein assembly factor BamD [Rickettsiales bacterium]